MEQNPVIQVVCRDGVHARVQRVPYEGTGGGEVYFGRRLNPKLHEFDGDGMRNEAADLWNLEGFWRQTRLPHPFDIIRTLTSQEKASHAIAI
jgi:hypothetical protein